MRSERIALMAAGAVMALGATAWGLMVSVGASEPAIRRATLPDGAFGAPYGRAETVASAGYGTGPGEVGLSTDGEVRGPSSIAVDDRDRVFVLDRVNGRVIRFTEGRPDETLDLPPGDYEDLVVAGETVCAMQRADNRSVTLLGPSGEVKVIAVSDAVPPVYRLFVIGREVVVECPRADGRDYHAIGTLEGATYGDSQQSKPRRMKTPLMNGGALTLARQSANDIAVDVDDEHGSLRTRLRAHSDRDVAAVLDACADRFGNLYVTWALTGDIGAKDTQPAGRLVVTRHAPEGEIIGRMETPYDEYAEPFRKTVVSESGDLYQLTTDESGARVLRWTLGQ